LKIREADLKTNIKHKIKVSLKRVKINLSILSSARDQAWKKNHPIKSHRSKKSKTLAL